MHNKKSRTPIAYYGGKQSMLKYILPMVPPKKEREVFTETFFGGGTVFFAIEPSFSETINDSWDIAINFYQVVVTDFPKLKQWITSSLVSRTQHVQAQSFLRRHANGEEVNRVTLAWAFWMCANFSFANKVLYGGVKYSNKQNSVVPDQMRNKKLRFTDWLVSRLEHAYIECTDANKVLLSRNVKKAFHYIDPPYPGADQGHYKGYTFEHFETLLQTCEKLTGRFLLSNYNSEMLDEYIKRNGWYKQEIVKTISASKTRHKLKTEVLVSNYTTTSFKTNTLF